MDKFLKTLAAALLGNLIVSLGIEPVALAQTATATTTAKPPLCTINLAPIRESATKILDRLAARMAKIPSAAAREELDQFITLFKASFTQDPRKTLLPKQKKTVTQMYNDLSAARDEMMKKQDQFPSSLEERKAELFEYVENLLSDLKAQTETGQAPTYEFVVQTSFKFSRAITITNVWKGETWAEPIKFEMPSLGIEAIYESILENLLNLAPAVTLRPSFDPFTFQDFNQSYFLPEIELGMIIDLTTYDGFVQSTKDGVENCYKTPREFYDHDAFNHGARKISDSWQDFFKMSSAKTKDGRSTILMPENILKLLEEIERRLDFQEKINAPLAEQPPAIFEAAQAILFQIYHENAHVRPDFSAAGLQSFLQSKNKDTGSVASTHLSKVHLIVDELVPRIKKDNDFGSSFPTLFQLPDQKIRESLESAIALFLRSKKRF